MVKQKQISQQGFTIVELLVALSVGTIVILMTMLLFVEGIRHTQGVTAEARTVKASGTLVETLAFHIRSAHSIESVDSGRLELLRLPTDPDAPLVPVIVEYDNSTRSILINGAQILDSVIVVDDMRFTRIDNVIEIQYELSTQFLAQPLVVSTAIATRN